MTKNLSAGPGSIYLPVIYHPKQQQQTALPLWHELYPNVTIVDIFAMQKKELFKIQQPAKMLRSADLDALYSEWEQTHDAALEGVWVYYPWLNKLIHILHKEEFITLRTNRNFYKITPKEQAELATKKIGIIGLSVGHAVALTMATERICSKLKLADFDLLELSNLNRIKTGIQNIGINKAIITAREIAEIDPFIEVECFTDGISEENIEQFLLGDDKLDILVDECDSIDIKILCRQKAKEHNIPVVMETSDRGMLDVERYDLEPGRALIHGLLEGIPLDQLKNLTTEQKIPLVLKIADVKKGSLRGKISMLEVGQSINTWPQLASSVTLGGAVVTDVCRRILLQQYHDSGRYYIDLEELAGDRIPASAQPVHTGNPFEPFDAEKTLASLQPSYQPNIIPTEEQIELIVKAACHAPSTGNDQPWKWIWHKGILLLFHDHYRSFSFGDFDNIASYISFGAAFENVLLQSKAIGLDVELIPNFENKENILVAAMRFHKSNENAASEKLFEPALINEVFTRCTNRNPSTPVVIPAEDLSAMTEAASSVEHASVYWYTEKKDLVDIATIIGECDRIRLLNPRGHYDFTMREMRWTAEEANNTKDGIDIRTLGLSGALQAALSIIRDPETVVGLKKLGAGNAFVNAAVSAVMKASAIGIIILPKYGKEGFFRGGMAMQRLWLKATALDYAIHPLISPFYLFPRITKADNPGLDESEVNKLKELRKRFLNIVPLTGTESEVFMFKIAKAAAPTVITLRLPLNETMFVLND